MHPAYSRRLRGLLTLLLLGLAMTAMADNTRIELIELQGRPAEELIPLLQPLVQPDGAISGSGYRLIVRAAPAQHAEIRRLLAELDHPPRRLLIRVHMGELSERQRQAARLHIEGHGEAGDLALGDAAPPDGRGATLGAGTADGSIGLHGHATRHLSERGDDLQVQTLEGQPAYIATGSDYPFINQLFLWRGRHGGGAAVDMQYRRTLTGFYALAQLHGERVTVRISPQQESLQPGRQGSVDGQWLTTTVSGRPGEWLRLGGSGSRGSAQGTATGSSHDTRELRASSLWLRVDLLD